MTDRPLSRQGIESPCVRICVVHPDARICTGCLRTVEEITGWLRYTPAERAEIMQALPDRAELLKKRRGGRRGKLARNGQD